MNNLLHTTKGSNQYRSKTRILGLKPKAFRDVCVILVIMLIVAYVGYNARELQKQLAMIVPIPFASTVYAEEPAELDVQTDEQREIVAYIKEVFGKDADKAFKLLSCENSSLNPRAVNTAGNTPAGSRDTGVFQINEYWQKVQYKFLLNYKVNIEIAHQIYTENGNTFERWTCGRKFGI